MNHTLAIDCPPEILVHLHFNAEEMGAYVKEQAAISLFKQGRMSSGTAAAWLGVGRVVFLMKAMEHGAVLLTDSADDLARETSL